MADSAPHAEFVELRADVRALDGKVDELRAALAELSRATASVVRLEVRHETAESMLRDIVARQAALETRLATIEREMPALHEVRSWIIRGVIGIVVAVGGAILAGVKLGG